MSSAHAFSEQREGPARRLEFTGSPGRSRLLAGVEPGEFVYFTHSYKAPVTANTAASRITLNPFASAVENANVMGVQFHPEKSGSTGLKILTNFSRGGAGSMITKRIIACLDVHGGGW